MYAKIKEVEAREAKERQKEAGGDRKSEEYKKSVTENFPQAKQEKGEARDKAAEKISEMTGRRISGITADDSEIPGRH